MAALHARILVPKFIERTLAEANAYLAQELARPREDTGPLKAEIRTTLMARDRLVKILDKEGEHDLVSVVTSLKNKERLLKELRDQLAEAQARDVLPPPMMTLLDVEGMLSDLRALLSGDMGMAASLLKRLIGPVVVEQVREENTKRGVGTVAENNSSEKDAIEKRQPKAVWVAEFTVNAVPILAQLTASRNCPTRGTWEYLKRRGWTTSESIVTRVTTTSIPHQFAAEIAGLVAKGASINSVSRALGLTRTTVQAALNCGVIDESIVSVPAIRTAGKDLPKLPLYMQIAESVALQRDEQRKTFLEIARNLSVSEDTVRRAYDMSHKESLIASVSKGYAPDRGRIPKLGVILHQEVVRLLKDGRSMAEVASEAGCSQQTVRRARKTLNGESLPSKVLTPVQSENRTRKRFRLGKKKHRELAALIEAGCNPAVIVMKVGCSVGTVYRTRRLLEIARQIKAIGQDSVESAAVDDSRTPPIMGAQQTMRAG